MAIRTRLDPLLRMHERREERALQDLAQAQARRQQQESALADVQSKVRSDARARGDVSSWQLAESAHLRALADAKKVQGALEAAQKQEHQAQRGLVDVRKSLESVRTVVDKRRAAVLAERERKEARELDEIGTLLHQLRIRG